MCHLAESAIALYLRGLRRDHQLPRKRWPLIEHALRSNWQLAIQSPADALATAGLWLEATLLRNECLMAEARSLVQGSRVLTAFDASYPVRWRYESFAPLALWQRGAPSVPEGPMFTIVGSRSIGPSIRSVARKAGAAVAASGGVVVSGAAFGCDREAAAGARHWASRAGVPAPVVEVLPHGISVSQSALKGTSYRSGSLYSGIQLSAAAPEEGFSSALAMERNALLYSASERSLVVACRFKEGGTWAGAVDALRRRLGSIWVWSDGSPGACALASLGAVPTRSIEAFILGDAPSKSLFG